MRANKCAMAWVMYTKDEEREEPPPGNIMDDVDKVRGSDRDVAADDEGNQQQQQQRQFSAERW